jgi:urease accessory protein
MRTSNFKVLGVAACVLFSPALLQAHILPGDPQGFHHGFVNPFTGLDHLLAMLAAGLWAAQQGGRAAWMIPASFVSLMTLGGMVGLLGGMLPGVEFVIAGSVLALGLLIATSARFKLGPAMLLAGCFALFHGYAHGREMPPAAGALAYSVGFVLATLALHAAGLLGGFWLQRLGRPTTLRFAGAGIAAASIWFFLS